jgi:holo-[acyl-carrier protein] synthase
VLETGVDIIEIHRIMDLVRRFGDRFGQRVFSAEEWREHRDRPASLAARFAAKEAAIKALGCSDIALHEIRVRRREGDRPRLELIGRAQARAAELGVRHVSLSLSHSRDYAVAVVVLALSTER